MPVHNADIAAIFRQVADLLEIEDANPFRVRAYRSAAQTVQGLSEPVADLIQAGDDVTDLPGIGKDLAGKIREIVETGSLEQLQSLRQRGAPELTQLLRIEGLGPKRVQQLHEALGITTPEELEQAARQQKVQALEGFGPKSEANILAALERRAEQGEERMLLMMADDIVGPLVEYLEAHADTDAVMVAGSYRRRKETVGDIDILAAGRRGPAIMAHFTAYEDVADIVSQGETRATVRLRSGLQVDLRVVEPAAYGAALLYFTGSKAHNIHLRKLARARDLKINEYGLFDAGDTRQAGATEEEIYAVFDLPWIPPELREDQGEFEAAAESRLPALITPDDIRGDLHVHTTASDGSASLEEMAQAAQRQGYSYIAVTDHSPHVRVAGGLDAARLEQQIDAIERLNKRFKRVRILKSAEVDILEDGSLDLPDEILDKLDLVVCSVHSKFRLSQAAQTERIITALQHPACTILAHPTGRMLNTRAPYDVDMRRILQAAREQGCFVELNAQPERLDLQAAYCRMAKELGVKIVISTDAHSADGLKTMRYGADQARRGWLEPGDVLNTRNLKELLDLLH